MKSPELRIGVVADCQFDAKAANVEGIIRGTKNKPLYCEYQASEQKWSDAIDTFNEHEVEFIVHLGDFIDRNVDYIDRLNNIADEKKSAPILHVFGNHEWIDTRATMSLLLRKLRMKNNYYTQDAGRYRFLLLDTNELGVLEHAEGSREWRIGRKLIDQMKLEGAINAYDWNGGLGERQMEWLDGQLTDAAKHDQLAYLMSHHPVYPPGVLNALNSKEILDLIDSHDNVAGFINGHNHGGAFGERKGVPYVTFPGMVGGSSTALGIVSLYPDRMEIEGYGRVQDMVLQRPLAHTPNHGIIEI